jgi:pimeloyl-ACP methyl ester carboxylesterase
MQPPSDPPSIVSQTTSVDGLAMHYLAAGDGEPLVLIHGYAETSDTWRAIIPALARRGRVIAPDLPGIGDSAVPAEGLDMTTAAVRVHALAESLGVTRARVVGHDIGMMIAYGYAALHPAEVDKLVLTPRTLGQLVDHAAIVGTSSPNTWQFTRNEKAITVPIKPALRVGTVLGIRAAAIAGLGLAVLPHFVITDDLEAGRLLPILRGASLAPMPVCAIYRAELRRSPRVAAFVAYLRAALPTEPVRTTTREGG